ncbi:MAG: SDR family NAD(P)-dependent oxidoreductase [Haloarculaceae archaeon]
MIPAGLDSALGEGDVALVTGSTGGIGREVAVNLAETGATVLVHGRDEVRARETVAALRGDGHDWYRTDFADLAEVEALADRVRDDYDRLDCLVNNAGTWQGERHLVDVPGADDVELAFVVNHLAPFLLTHRLVDRLAATGRRREERGGETRSEAESENGAEAGSESESSGGPDPARVVTVSSQLHRRATLDLDSVRGPEAVVGVEAYSHSKLANVLFTVELARRLPEPVVANCCHPGSVPTTDLSRDGSLVPSVGWRLFGFLGGLVGLTDSPADAAETPTYLASAPEAADFSGEYFEDREAVPPGDGALDREAQRRLWERSAEWTGVSTDRLPADDGSDPGR